MQTVLICFPPKQIYFVMFPWAPHPITTQMPSNVTLLHKDIASDWITSKKNPVTTLEVLVLIFFVILENQNI